MSNDFERFCGGTFWDANLTWSNDVENPDFTPCFHRTIFVWTPVFFLAILAPFEVRRYRNSKSHKIPRNWYNTTKLVLTLCLAIMAIVDLILLATGGDNGKAVVDADYVAAAFYVFGSGLSLFLLVASLIHGIRTSPAQFVYYLVATVCGAVTLR
jgi:ATP-binding cassette subfamily C (CFTR/MRP) protein 1